MENSFVLVFVIGLLSLSNFPKSSIAADTITPNETITHPKTIISAGGRFELGFFSPKNDTSYYLGIWYKAVFPQTVVWVANRDYPILSSSASLSICSNGNIVIFDSKMNYSVTNTASSCNTYATLLDSGNLVLMDRDQNLQVLWQSFDYPTDTLLPGMKLGYDELTNISWSLVSWKSSKDPVPGVFSLALALDPQLEREQLNIKNGSKIYWTGATQDFELFAASDMVGGKSTEKSNYVTWADDLGDSTISRIVLDVSGQLKLQSWSRTDDVQEWHTIQVSKCGRSGCGPFSICNKTAQMPCACLPGFKSESNDSWAKEPGNIWAVHARRCVRKAVLGCNSSSLSKKDRFLPIENADLPINPLKLAVRSRMECESASLSNCSWIAYSFYEETRSCFLWDNDLLDLKQLLEGDANGRDFYLKLADSELNSLVKDINQSIFIFIANERIRPILLSFFDFSSYIEPNPINGTQADLAYEKNTGNKKQLLIIVILTISLTVVTTLSFVMLCVRGKLRRKGEDLLLFDLGTSPKADSAELTGENQLGKSRKNEVKLPLFSFASVSAVTDNFSAANKLGEGGFGLVYKGTLLKGDEIAVKRLSRRSGQGWEELKNEAQLIANLQHKNLVRLFGCCIEKDEKILIYEYMPNKSLDFFIFDPIKRKLLDWGTRVRIIEGIAQGVLYLHQYSRLRIIHRDLKASNILLDIDMNPKISDFGMARIFGGNESQANTNRIVGTYGYMSPEYAVEGIFSIKSDVFSFGVLLLEIVSGKKNTGFYQTASLNLLGYAWDMWKSDKGLELKDPVIEVVASSNHMLIRYVNIGLLCVQESAEDRPTMSDVVSMLINETAPLPPPKQPAFSHVRSCTANSKPPIGSSSSRPDNCSVNNVTVSILQAR